MGEPAIPVDLEKYVAPSVPERQRLMVAKGAIPIAPKILLPVLAFLTKDPVEEIRTAALASARSIPESILVSTLKDDLPGFALEQFALLHADKPPVVEALLSNPATPDSAFIELAKVLSGKFLEMIAENQERIIRTTEIYHALSENAALPRSTLDRLTQFLVLAGIIAPSSQTTEVLLEEVDATGNTKKDAAPIQASARIQVKEQLNEEEKQNLLKMIATMPVGAKIQLALKGNREARGYLIRDTNKVVAVAVMKSPKLNDQEVARYATLRNVSEEVLRLIAVHPEYSQNYSIRMGLVGNPKTPIQFSMQFVRTLNVRDLQITARNKNISSQVTKVAKALLREKQGG